MKNVLLLFMLAFSTIAIANTKEETHTASTNIDITSEHDFKNGYGNHTENDTIKTKRKIIPLANRIDNDGSRFSISVLVVDFINRNNIKIAKRILKK
ncbi:MAG: hypothetical protein BM557_04275 [Flavobacterium sp. MedPE-SWcel]|uniref:hypothetical protein n=1 Tax=uncultured Flavobacterium sp. TaxID=165435 RepID=UPI00091CA61C|nr:hypothetical protein [uncultured Flavobacterium sp.]OIQ21472.1 MAG: hypothetical protein BM557_04275 [Flavobacterium sp. MedPE-SWcel]